MCKALTRLLFLLLPLSLIAQDYSNLWKGYFSFYNIKDVVQGNNKLYAASENAVFSYDFATLEMEEITTVNGLSGEFISTIHYSKAYGLLLIGYQNGLMEVVSDSGEILTVVDIVDKPTIPPNRKKINHFNEYGNVVYIATEYGISVYNLEFLEFGDTYYIGNGGTQISVRQTTIYDGYIYTACFDNNGVKKGLLTSPNLIDYQQWQTITTGNFLAVQSHVDQLYAIRSNNTVSRVVSDVLTQVGAYSVPVLDVKSSEGFLVVVTRNDAYLYDESFSVQSQISRTLTTASEFTSAITYMDNVYIGTLNRGVLGTQIFSPTEFLEIHPDSPLMNSPFSIEAYAGNLWVAYGDYTQTFNPSPLRQWGLSHLKEEDWVNIPYDSVLGARDLSTISINPFNPDQVFLGSFNDGILEINDDVPTILYNQNNSGLESLVNPNAPNAVSIRVSATTFDSNGLLWSMTGRVEKPLKSYDPVSGNWQAYSFAEILPNPLGDEFGYSELVIDANGNKWAAGYKKGLIGYSHLNGAPILKTIETQEQNLPAPFVTALAVDNRNQLWVGTISGLRVLYNTSGFFTNDNPELDSIIIVEDDGVPAELLFQQYISSIEVDGSNNKWVGTYSTGLYYFTSDGQETIHHFTTDNSPLPSNNIIDLSLDQNTGILYIATDRGLLSYSSGASGTQEDLASAFVYPNPVRPTFNITEDKIKIKDISENVNIKITDIEGNLVAEAQSRTNLRYKGYNLEIDGGIAYWNGKNLGNNVVASGVYLIMLTDLDSLETKVLKVMVIR